MLTEIFKSPVEYRVADDGDLTATFKINDHAYVIELIENSDDIDIHLDIMGDENEDDARYARDQIGSQEVWDLSFYILNEDGSYSSDLTGFGEFARVFSTVVDAAKKLINKANAEIISVHTVGPSATARMRLYKKIIQRLGGKEFYSSEKDNGSVAIFDH